MKFINLMLSHYPLVLIFKIHSWVSYSISKNSLSFSFFIKTNLRKFTLNSSSIDGKFLLMTQVVHTGTSSWPLFIASIQSCGAFPSMVQPTDCAVPRISLTVPEKCLAIDLGLISLAMLKTSSIEIFPSCFTVEISK